MTSAEVLLHRQYTVTCLHVCVLKELHLKSHKKSILLLIDSKVRSIYHLIQCSCCQSCGLLGECQHIALSCGINCPWRSVPTHHMPMEGDASHVTASQTGSFHSAGPCSARASTSVCTWHSSPGSSVHVLGLQHISLLVSRISQYILSSTHPPPPSSLHRIPFERYFILFTVVTFCWEPILKVSSPQVSPINQEQDSYLIYQSSPPSSECTVFACIHTIARYRILLPNPYMPAELCQVFSRLNQTNSMTCLAVFYLASRLLRVYL